MANPFYIEPGNDFSQGLTGLGSVLRDLAEQKRLREAEEAARIKEEQTLLDINTAIDSGDPDQIHKAAIKYPRIAESIYRGFDIKRTDRKDQLKTDILGMITAPPDQIPSLFENRIKAIEARGLDSSHTRGEYEEFLQYPEERRKNMIMAYASLATPQEWEAYKKTAEVKPPEIKEFKEGDRIVTKQWNPQSGQYEAIGDAPRFNKDAGTNVSVNVDNTDKAFASEFGKVNAQQFFERRSGALDAVNSLASNKEARELLDKGVITGAGANLKLELGKALQLAGFNISQDAIANTEAYIGQRAQEVGRIIKLFGAGTGLSDADREFARQAAAGDITYTAESIRRLLDINDRAARNIVKAYNQDAAQIPSEMSPYPLTIDLPEEPNDEDELIGRYLK